MPVGAEEGHELGEFYYPMGVATNEHGDVLVSDMMNARVQVFDATHNPYEASASRQNRGAVEIETHSCSLYAITVSSRLP